MSLVTEGLVPRPATPDDVEEIVALNVAHNGADTEPVLRRLLADPGVFTVVEADGRVVSTLCLLRDAWRMRGVEIPLGRPEFVVTDEAFRGRGLVRAQMEVVHRRSEGRGDLAQLITGIPYFYRQFGYEYATMPDVGLQLASGSVARPPGWTVRPAQPDDAEPLCALTEAWQASFELVGPRDAAGWRGALEAAMDPIRPLVALSPSGEVEGFGVVQPGPGEEAPPALVQLACPGAEALLALCAEATGPAGLLVWTPPGTLVERVLGPVGSRRPAIWGPVLRVPDPVALLRHLSPVLTERLGDSAFASASGELYLSFHRSGVRIAYESGRVVSITETGRAEKNPVEEGGAGVPPDLVATLIFGAYGASGLEERYRDVDLGTQRALMDVLFPPVSFSANYFE